MKNRYLSENYGVFGTARKGPNRLTVSMRRVIANPIGHYLVFGALMLILGYLSANKLMNVPYSVQSALASTFAYAIAAVGFCLLMGYSGLASLGIGGFIAIGCYSVYYIMNVSDMSFWVALAAALAVGSVIGLIVGFISLRIEGIYLVILTLGLSEILRNLFVALKDSITMGNWELFGMKITRSDTIYVVTVLLVMVMIITHNLINSPTGRAMLAMKNSTAAAQAMGISLLKYRLLAFVICSIYSVLAGMIPEVSQGFRVRAVSRTAKEGVASTTRAQSFTALKSQVRFRLSGRRTPLSWGFSRLPAMVRHLSSRRQIMVTSLPFSSSTSARAVPQPPLPTTAVLTWSPPRRKCRFQRGLRFQAPPPAWSRRWPCRRPT